MKQIYGAKYGWLLAFGANSSYWGVNSYLKGFNCCIKQTDKIVEIRQILKMRLETLQDSTLNKLIGIRER